MKKGNRKYLVVAALLLLVAISFGTYAIYKSSASGNAEAEVAAWVVKVNGTDITSSSANTYTFRADPSDIVWDANANVASGKIAPGSTGKIKLAIDTSEAEVAVHYVVSVDSSSIDNDKLAITNTGSNAEGDIAVDSDGANIEVTVVWTAEDVAATNTKDMALAGSNISIPITVTLTQKVA